MSQPLGRVHLAPPLVRQQVGVKNSIADPHSQLAPLTPESPPLCKCQYHSQYGDKETVALRDIQRYLPKYFYIRFSRSYHAVWSAIWHDTVICLSVRLSVYDEAYYG